MGWERRVRGGRYYTRSRRDGGRVVWEYVGGGAAGEAAARHDALERERRAAERVAQIVQRRRIDEAERALTALEAFVQAAICVSLEAAGFRQHHRGEWRKSRGGGSGAARGRGHGREDEGYGCADQARSGVTRGRWRRCGSDWRAGRRCGARSATWVRTHAAPG